jgi:hypothetical protein
LRIGIRQISSGPLVRSSFMADEVYGVALEGA